MKEPSAPGFPDNFMEICKEDSAGSIAESDHQNAEDRPAGPGLRHPEIEHVSNAVLCSAEDKDHYPEKQRKVFAELMRVAFKAFHANENTNVAKRVREVGPMGRPQGFNKDGKKWDKDGKIVSDTQRYKCLGNAVTTSVVTFIANNMFRSYFES